MSYPSFQHVSDVSLFADYFIAAYSKDGVLTVMRSFFVWSATLFIKGRSFFSDLPLHLLNKGCTQKFCVVVWFGVTNKPIVRRLLIETVILFSVDNTARIFCLSHETPDGAT